MPQEADTTTEAYKGVSKGEGTHCKRCKSRFHDEKDCPTLKREQASQKQATPKARAKQARLVTSVFDALPNRTFASPTAEQTSLSVEETNLPDEPLCEEILQQEDDHEIVCCACALVITYENKSTCTHCQEHKHAEGVCV